MGLWRLQGNGLDESNEANHFTTVDYSGSDFTHGITEHGTTAVLLESTKVFSIAGGAPSADFNMGTDDFTVEIWALMLSALSSTDVLAIGKPASGSDGGWNIVNDGSWRITLNIFDGTTSKTVHNNTPTRDNIWHLHTIVIKRSTGEALFYLDGVLVATTDISTVTGTINNSSIFRLRAFTQSDVIIVDEAAITRRELTATEILQRYTGQSNFGTWGM